MKPIQKEELYNHVSQFLKTKGIELKDGSYPHGIQASCSLLADVINLSQKGIKRAKTEIDKSVERVRQVIHEKTAPAPPRPRASKPKAASSAKSKAKPQKRGTAKR